MFQLFSTSINDLLGKNEDKKNETAATSILEKIGHLSAKRLMKEFLDDAMDKVNANSLDKKILIIQKYYFCKNKSKYPFSKG